MKTQLFVAGLVLILLSGCDSTGRYTPQDGAPPAPAATEAATHRIIFEAEVPDGTPALYLSGNIESLGPWAPDGLVMSGEGPLRTAGLDLPAGLVFEYKFTLGSWDREALGPSGMVMGNNRLVIDGPKTVRHAIGDFKKDAIEYVRDVAGSGVVGTLIYRENVTSAYLAETRHVSIWLPPGYDDDPARRYPVIYMSDGQNLFDPRIANTGVDWGIDEAMVAGMEDGLFEPAIVVSIWSTAQRGWEYSPWHGAPLYARFLKEELKPSVDAAFRTLIDRENTFHIGSSMGGLLSFYLVRDHAETFSACGCMSTHTPFSPAVVAEFTGQNPAGTDETPFILADIAAGATMPKGQRLFLDFGTETLDAAYGPGHAAIRDWLLAQGFIEREDFLVREYSGAAHNEAAWRARVKDQLAWLLAPR